MTRSKLTRLVLLVMSLLPLFSRAQSEDTIETRADAIKLDEHYVYGEGIDESKDIAYDNALSDLIGTANILRDSKGKAALEPSALKPHAQRMDYKVGQRNAVFLYLPIDKMLSLTAQASAPTQPTVKPQFPAKPAVSQQPPAKPVANDVAEALCAQDSWVEIKPLLVDFKQRGKISQTGTATSLTAVPDDAFAILMDGMGGILSIRSPKSEGQRTELKDDAHNNNNCKFIVWYR